jgi:hypothetical protein
MRRAAMVAVLIGILVAAGCSKRVEIAQEPGVEQQPGATWTVVSADGLDEAQMKQQQHAQEAIQAMASRLMGELTAALDDGGPDAGIEVCSVRAPEISAAVANEFGVHLGRTSFKLRNRSNLPPEWAERLVDLRTAEPTWLVGPNGELAGLIPIRLKAECSMCHGPREQISDEVLAKIDDYYPDDEAVGFAEGDLRGWFWVETPSS